jgi:hypothetical protein
VVTTSGDIVTLTFTGTVDSSQDLGGTFGCNSESTDCSSDGNPYNGYTLTEVYTFNTGLGYTENNSAIIQATGGSSQPPSTQFGTPDMAEPPPSPLLSDTVTLSDGSTIVGTYSVDGSYNSNLQITSFSGISDAPYTLTASVNDVNGNELFSQLTSSDIPYSLTTSFGPTDFGPNAGSTELNFDCTGPASSPTCSGFLSADLTVQLTNDSATVPQPSTWALMAIGFAGLGLVGYRRAKIPAVA